MLLALIFDACPGAGGKELVEDAAAAADDDDDGDDDDDDDDDEDKDKDEDEDEDEVEDDWMGQTGQEGL